MSANEGEPQPLIDDELGGVREECQEGEKDTEYHDRLRVNLSTLDEGHPHGAAGVNRKVLKVTHKPSFLSRPPRSGCLGVLDRLRLAFNVIIPYGGLLSSSFNLASATLGAGIISTPSAFNLSGVVMSTIYLVLVTLGTIYSMNLIAKVIVKTGVRTFAQAARQILGPGADHILATLLIILCFGGSVAYIIATSTLLAPILSTDSAPAYLKTKSGNRLITSLFWLCFMVPLVIPKKVNSLRYISTFAIFFVMYFVVCIVIHSTQNGLKDSTIRKEMVMVRTGNTALEGLGVFMFALLCQINGFEIFLEMRVRTVFNFTLYTTIATVMCSTLYFLAGFFGYADFGERVKDSVLKLYDPISEPYILVGYIGIIIKICVAFALHMIPFRDAIYHFLKWEADSVPYWQHSLVMLIPSTLALLGGLFIPYVNTVFGLLGSFCGGIIGMIMPALFYMYAGNFSLKETGILNYVSTYLLLLGGVCAVVFGTVTTIYSTVMSSFA